MTYEDALKFLMSCYPIINPLGEVSVLNHLFFTVGNGYYWSKGELISHDDFRNDDVDTRIKRGLAFHRRGLLRDADYWEKRDKSSYEFYINEYRAMLDLDWSEKQMRNADVDPDDLMFRLSQYCLIFHIPPSVKDDWLLAAIKAVETNREYVRGDHMVRDLKFVYRRLLEEKDRRGL